MTRSVNVGIIYTMNASQEMYEQAYKPVLSGQEQAFGMPKGKLEMLPVFDTLQVKDYGKYSMASFDAEKRQLHHEEHFPVDLAHAFNLGTRLSS